MKNYNKGIFRDHEEVWVEKYRPRTFDDLICDKETKEKLESFIAAQDVPNLLFEGSAGTGKSSVVNLIIKGLDCDFKEINAANENGIDTVRNTIVDFCMTAGYSKIKLMVLQEFSEFSPQGQGALRDVIEKNSKHVRFLATCNTVERIIEPIRSRLQEFKILPPSKQSVYERCRFILKNEGVSFEEDELTQTVDLYYPDVRKCIQALEQQTVSGILKLSREHFKLLRWQENIINILHEANEANMYDKLSEIRQIIANSRVKNFAQLFRYVFDRLDDYCPKKGIVNVIYHLEEGLKYDSFVADKEINVIATLMRILEEVVDARKK